MLSPTIGRRRILLLAAVRRNTARSRNMGSEVRGQIGSPAHQGAEQQCLIRDANEAIELSNTALTKGVARLALRCECGDPACQSRVSLTHAEYEAVRAYGSRFVVGLNHENPENAWVLSEHPGFAVIDVVASDARYEVLARHPRHAWVEARDRDTR
jgi:hypothetical protein